MGEVKNLDQQEGLRKLRELAKNEICLFCTFEVENHITVRPMGTQDIDEEGNIWFFSRNDSEKNMQIEVDHRVQLLYSNPSRQNYLSVEGIAIVLRDSEKIREIWKPIAKAWFSEGKDDPSLTLIKVIPDQAHYWDTKNGKMVSFLKIIAASITGKTMDGGVEGNIKIR